jgi:beta-lactamase regulating signal transducer with metallopeptidase domain
MNVIDAAAALLWHSAVFSVAVVCALLLRPLLLRATGAAAAYASWALVPAATVGAALSALVPTPLPSAAAVLQSNLPWLAPAGLQASASANPAAAAALWCALLLAVWAGVALVLLLRMVWQHQQVLRLLAVEAVEAVEASTTQMPTNPQIKRMAAGSGPALVGAWRPMLCLPRDFETRFDKAEQKLMLQHEAVHLARHDNLWNLLAALLHTAQWFNPLAWWALRRMRADQELACDAATMRALLATDMPNPVDKYIHTLLKAQGLGWPAVSTPLASSWSPTHPLVERVSHMLHHPISATRRVTGRVLAVALSMLASTFALSAGHALQPVRSATDSVMVYVTLDLDGKPFATPRLFGALGSTMSIRMSPDAGPKSADRAAALTEPLVLDITPSAGVAGQLQAKLALQRGEPLQAVAQPRLVGAEGESMRIEHRSAAGAPLLGLTIVMRRMDKPDMQAAPR